VLHKLLTGGMLIPTTVVLAEGLDVFVPWNIVTGGRILASEN
jgi:hypothetical protein